MKKLSLFTVLICLTGLVNAQFIISGQHSINDYHYQFVPDSIVINIPQNPPNYNPQFYLIDINNDGIMDFQFALRPPTTALGMNSDYCTLSGLNNNNVALGYFDTCYTNTGVYVNRFGIAHEFNYNYSINSNANWDSLVYLNYYTVYTGSYGCGCPNCSFTAYIGVRVQVASSYKYGWIKIAGLTFNPWGNTTLTMGEFACENIGNGVNMHTNNRELKSVYPNPANDKLTIESLQKSIILISDMQGQVILEQNLKQGITDINISGLSKGIYILKQVGNNKTEVTRIIKE
ncbi:MAG: T9SS type A sorting domain-containing protein [Bacteroidia bacterium]|nr:T9SS type A sorting domain-containing protein [Bacteroidia bacterium]